MKTRPTLHQLVHTLSYGDAISTEVLALQQAIQALGYNSEIYALHEHPNYRGRTRSVESLSQSKDTHLILHYSLGSSLNDIYANWTDGGRILVYHNITPAHWYREINTRVSDDILRGVKELPVLCELSDQIWADSAFNARELGEYGQFDVEVLDLLVSDSRWNIARDERIYSAVKGSRGCQVLHVGRLAPNKCLEDVIKIFYFLVRYADPDSRLRLVGIDTDTEMYAFALRDLADRLGIGGSVEFTGALSDSEVRALYESSDVYLCMSEHEGFCLPLIESMHFGLPVVAFSAAAVPETLGDAGILVCDKRHAEVAKAVDLLSRDNDLRQRLVEKGKKRVERYSPQEFFNRVEILTRDFLESKALKGAMNAGRL